MPSRILHVSDLHVGARDDPTLEQALAQIAGVVEPELVLASGDLSHRGRPEQHARAATLLRGVGVPVVAVPGNHDIPFLPPARVGSPWETFEQEWSTTEPVHAGADVHVVGLNSVRPWHHQSGGVDDAALDRAAARLAEAATGALRVVVLHHQLIGAPWRSRKRPVARRGHVLARLVDAGADLVVGGHIHQAAVSERHEFDATDVPGAILAIAPGLGQPRPARHREARGALAYLVDRDSVVVETHIWRGDGFRRTASRVFPRLQG
jgi:3',5'-cyclic AMP phosphodiesterase CpdA